MSLNENERNENDYAKSLCKNTFHVDEIKQVAMSVGLAIDKFSDTLFELNNHGFLLKKSSQVYQLLSAE